MQSTLPEADRAGGIGEMVDLVTCTVEDYSDHARHASPCRRRSRLYRGVHAGLCGRHGHFLPPALPLLAPGLAIDAWLVARPLVALLLLPLVVGLVVRARFAGRGAVTRGRRRAVRRCHDFGPAADRDDRLRAGLRRGGWQLCHRRALLFAVATTVGAWLTGIGWPLTGDGRLVSASAHVMRSLRTSARCFRRSAHYGDDRTGRSGHPAL